MFVGQGYRKYSERVELTLSPVVVDAFGHAQYGEPQVVLIAWASVTQMSADKTMRTFQQADIIGLDIEMRNPAIEFNGLQWNGHQVFFASPEKVGMRERLLRLQGWYQVDNPLAR